MEHKLLEKIKSPSDIKKLSDSELPQLCDEVRDTIISTVSENGGHLASNLGVVELTVALHKVFDSPNDKIIWDVGHQVYTHKLLTGRYNEFSTLRQENGISGFSRPNESEHDIVYSGHSSVSISTALGIATANKANNKKNYAIAVIGDGAITGGLVYEAINNAGHQKDARLIIILNDNGMSISKNTGYLAKRLAVMRSRTGYFKLKALTEKVVNRIPFVGKKLANKLFKVKTDIKNMLYQSNFFEDFGVRYMGPIDGHNISQLCDALEGAKLVKAPVIVHINTVKGKGYVPAENSPSSFHGVAPFDKLSGELASSKDNFSEKFGEFLYNQAPKDKRVCAITAAMSLGTGLQRFSENYPDRFFDVGIAEEHAIPFALGMSKSGMLPVFVVYSTFLQRCYDQLMHDFALQQSKMVVAVDRAGIVGDDGETHNGIYDTSFFNGIPNITVYSPTYYCDLNNALVNSLYHNNGPCVIRYPRGKEPQKPDDYECSGNTFDVFGDKEADLVIVTYGRIFSNALKCADELRKENLKVKVIKLNVIIPIDDKCYSEINSYSKVFFFEEGVKTGGIGEAFATGLIENGIKADYRLTAIPDCFVKQGKVESILDRYNLSADGMLRVVKGASNER
ncbi:MAG: 1-deoxy-D-xylulose-5-phosphate synthase [Oscillospiraceae bacterium]|nr:1-deoxy-D-xylulose-5-phosphate synthase [Oscillospiraceae bacterium]